MNKNNRHTPISHKFWAPPPYSFSTITATLHIFHLFILLGEHVRLNVNEQITINWFPP
eukprot:c24947_g2_i1 orf=105-278(-)